MSGGSDSPHGGIRSLSSFISRCMFTLSTVCQPPSARWPDSVGNRERFPDGLTDGGTGVPMSASAPAVGALPPARMLFRFFLPSAFFVEHSYLADSSSPEVRPVQHILNRNTLEAVGSDACQALQKERWFSISFFLISNGSLN